jgi:hypothetical protein
MIIASGPMCMEPPSRRRPDSKAIFLLDSMLPQPERMGIEFLHEFLEEWSERERDAFGLGVHIGMRVADALEARFASQDAVDDDRSSTETRDIADRE